MSDFFWRIETAKRKPNEVYGYGPYCADGEWGHVSRGASHPAPYSDGLDGFDRNCIFGFNDLCQARAWWFDADYMRNYVGAARLAAYRKSKCAMVMLGGTQVVFRPDYEPEAVFHVGQLHDQYVHTLEAMANEGYHYEAAPKAPKPDDIYSWPTVDRVMQLYTCKPRLPIVLLDDMAELKPRKDRPSYQRFDANLFKGRS